MVVTFGALTKDFDIQFKGEHPFRDFKPNLCKLTFNLTKRTCQIEQLTHNMVVEFPIVDPGVVSRKNKYSYVAYRDHSFTPKSKEDNENMFFKGFVKFDLQQKQIAGKIYYGDSCWGGEVMFQRR